MSDEYRIHIGAKASLAEIGKRLKTLGLHIVKSADDFVWLALDGSDSEQVQRWGGHVRIEREGDDLFVTLNATSNRKMLIATIVDALVSQGLHASVEEI